jgi:hypothetical protein
VTQGLGEGLLSGVLGVALVAARRIQEDHQTRVGHVKELGDVRGHVHTTTPLSSDLEQKTLESPDRVPADRVVAGTRSSLVQSSSDGWSHRPV